MRLFNKNNRVGAWRSLVAKLHGVQGVPSSNLGAPTSLSGSFPVTSLCARKHTMSGPISAEPLPNTAHAAGCGNDHLNHGVPTGRIAMNTGEVQNQRDECA